MSRAHQEHSPRGSPPPSSQQSKMMLQREYREKEGECFNTLRDVIKELLGEELRTRHEILRKAIDILLTALEMKKQKKAQADTLMQHQIANLEDSTSAHAGYFPQLSLYSPQSWQPSPNLDAAHPDYGAYAQNQQHYFVSSADHTHNPAGSDLSGYPQL